MSDIEKSEIANETKSEAKTLKLETPNYKDSQSSADDNRSSGWVLLIVGLVGIVVVILGMLGVIPFKFANPYLFYGVLCAVFVLFCVMGVVSFVNAKKFDSKAKGEKTLQETLIKWSEKNLNSEIIDKEIDNVDSESDEILYFKRTKVITDMLNKQFVNLDPAFLEVLIDNVIYESVFPLPESSVYQIEIDDEDEDYDDFDFEENESDSAENEEVVEEE